MNTILTKIMAPVLLVGLMLMTASPVLAFNAPHSQAVVSHSATTSSSSNASHASASAVHTSTPSAATSNPVGARPTVTAVHLAGPALRGPSNASSNTNSNNNSNNGPVGISTFVINQATAVSSTAATLNLSYTIAGCDANTFGVDTKFVYDTTPILNYTSSPSTMIQNFSAGSGTWSQVVTGLTPNTTYYYGMLGNGCQFTYTSGSQVQSFSTPSGNTIGASTFIVTPATAITQTTADLNLTYVIAAIDSTNGGVDVKFVYDTTPNISYTNSPSTTFTLLASGSGTMTRTITGLTPNTTYYYRILGNGYQTNYIGNQYQTFGTMQTSTSTNAPIITTNAASSIGTTVATLNGNYNANNSASTIWFEYGTTPALGASTSAQSVAATSASTFNAALTGLTSNTTYYFRAVGQNAFGTSYGSILNFSTTSTSTSTGGGHGGSGISTPDITTDDATSVSDTHATLNGRYNANGAATSTWFEFSKNKSEVEDHSATVTSMINRGTGIDDFSVTAPGTLVAGTTYYFRAAAENTKGTVYGTIKSFTTIGTPADANADFTALTSLATTVGFTGATLNGIVRNPTNESIKSFFEYGTSAGALTQSTGIKSLGNATTSFASDVIGGLAPDTMYYFRIVATGTSGTSRGEIRFFKTSGGTVIDTSGGPVSPSETVTGTSSKFISLSISDLVDEVAPGDTMSYDVSFQNKTGKDLANTVLEIALPNEVSFESASDGQFDSATNTLVVNVGTLGANIEGKISIDAKVTNDARGKSFLLTNALMKYVNPDTSAQEEAIAYVVNSVIDNGNALGAASIFGDGSFLPNTLVGWLSLLLVIAGLIFLGRYVYVGQKRKQEYAPDNLPQ